MQRAKFISPSGKEIVMRITRTNRDNKVWAERDGWWAEFSDPLYDPRDGELAFVETIPEDRTLQPLNRRTIPDLARLDLQRIRTAETSRNRALLITRKDQ
jgi:hypothetical protein